MLARGIPRPDIEAAAAKLAKYEIIPVGLYNYGNRRWETYITGNSFKWSSKRYPIESTVVEIELESGLYDYIENLIADTRVGWSGKPAEPIIIKRLRIEFIPKSQREMYWTNYGERGPEYPHIQSLVIGHDLEDGSFDKGIAKRPSNLKNPKEWRKVLEHYAELNRKPKVVSSFILPAEQGARLRGTEDYFYPDYGYGGGLGEGMTLRIDEKYFKSVARFLVPRLRLAQSSMSKELPKAVVDMEKKLFVDWLNRAAEVYEIPEQEVAEAVFSAQTPIDFDLVAEEPVEFDFSSPITRFVEDLFDDIVDIIDFFRELFGGRRTSITPKSKPF